MPTVHIYQGGKRIESRPFRNDFFIVQEIDGGRLFWEADEEQRSSKRGGVIQVWIRAASHAPRMEFGLKGWRLTIDGVTLKEKFYERISLMGKSIELEYDDYRFVCSFPN